MIMIESNGIFSERKIMYCDILKKRCIQDHTLYLQNEKILIQCGSCHVYKDKVINPHHFADGTKVETTEDFKLISGVYISGVVESSDFNNVNIVTKNNDHYSIKKGWVQVI